MRSLVFSLFLLFFSGLTNIGAQAGSLAYSNTSHQTLSLLSSAQAPDKALTLASSEWAYLRQKTELRLGVVNPGKPPVDIVGRSSFKGVSADVIALLGRMLHLQVGVYRYDSLGAALQALQAGEIDLLAGASGGELEAERLAWSLPYAMDIPAIYRRPKDTLAFSDDLAGAKIAIVEGYLTEATLAALYPRAEFVRYRFSSLAMAATAFGQVDLLLSDTLSARYLINQSYFNEIKIDHLLKLPTRGFAFALHPENQTLLQIIDTALTQLGKPTLDALSRRWVGGGYDLPEDRLALTSDEQMWLAQNPVVKIAVNSDQAPVAFIAKDGSLRGMAADILELVTQRTGLQFEAERVNDFASLVDAVRDSKADLSVVSWTPEREAFLRFTHPVVVTPLALFVRRDAANLGQLSELRGKKLALAKGHAYTQYLTTHYPDISLLETATSLQALREVETGKADAAVTGMILGRYYLSKFYDDTLMMSGVIDDSMALASFAMRRSDVELQSILNKVILAIPPEEMNVIASRWRPNADMSGETWWDYRRMLFSVIGLAVIVVGLFTAWALYLRYQIAKRMASERALNDQLELVQALSEATPQPIYVRDIQGRFVSGTRSYLEAVGAKAEDLLGTTLLDKLSKFGAAKAMHEMYMQAMKDNVMLRVLRATKVNGEERWIDHWAKPFYNAAGVMQGVVCGWLDVTEQQRLIIEQKRLISELKEARKVAVQSNWEKSNFLATMSHEIRTPLSAVIGTLELVQLQAEQGVLDKSGIQIAYSCASGLLDLMGNVLDFARIEAGRLVLSPERVNLKEVLESVILVFEGMAHEKGLNLLLELDSDNANDVLIDPVRLKQLLFNLVSNAIKFTAIGHVKISAIVEAVEAAKVRLQLMVTDTGIGISAVDQERLFHPFEQVKQEGSEQQGVGLGLMITRSLCEVMGGSLTLHSVLGTGTTVTVTFVLHQLEPLERGAGSALPMVAGASSSTTAMQPLRVLVVEDYDVQRQLLCLQLEFLGHQFSEAKSAQEALALWRANHFDMVITDCRMPGMSGAELTNAIRTEEQSAGRARCVILGLTADAQREEIERFLSSGMDECLVKPLELELLKIKLRALASHVDEKPPTATVERNSLGSDMHPISVTQHTLQDGLETLMTLTGGNSQKAGELAHAILNSLKNVQIQLPQALDIRDHETIALLAHQVLGVARVLGDQDLALACQQIEQQCQRTKVSHSALVDATKHLLSLLSVRHAYYQQLVSGN